MYFYNPQGSHSGEHLGWSGQSSGQVGQLVAPFPRVTGFTFRTGLSDEENCCQSCADPPMTGTRKNLGVGLQGSGVIPLRAANGMQLAFTIADHRPGIEYDITRTRRNSLWQRVAGAWTRLESNPMGTNDDHRDTDECLRLSRTNRIFAIDTPGWPNAVLPVAAAISFGALNPAIRAAAAATELVFRFSFAEWVIARNRAEGIPWTRLQLPPFANGTPRQHIYWHSVTRLIRTPAGDVTGPWVLGPGNAIQLGSLSADVINSAPA